MVFTFLASVASCYVMLEQEAEAERRGRAFGQRGTVPNQGGGQLPTYAPDARDIAVGLRFYFRADAIDDLYQEPDIATSVAVTKVSGNGDPVGRLSDPMYGHVTRAPSTASRPTYNASGPYLSFDGVDDWMAVHNSVSAFNFVHQTAVFTMTMTIGVHGDGASETLLDNIQSSTANAGFVLLRTSGDVLQFILTRGSAGTNTFLCTTTDTLQDADDRVDVEIRANNAAGMGIRINGGTEVSCARNNAPSGGDALGDLTFGARTGGANDGELELQEIAIWDRYLSDTELSTWRAQSKSGGPTTLVRQVGPPNCAGYPWFSHLHRDHDFTDASLLWQDTGRSVAVASNNDPVRVADHAGDWTSTQDLNRTITAPSDAERPLWQDDGSGVLFDGSDDDLLFDADDAMRAGARTWVAIVRHDNTGSASDFSRVSQAGTGYWVCTGDDYAGNPGGAAYCVWHPVGSDVGTVSLGQEVGFNLVAAARDGSSWITRARGGGSQNTGGGTNADQYGVTGLSDDASSGADGMDGWMARWLGWQFAATSAQLDIIQAGLLDCHSGLGL